MSRRLANTKKDLVADIRGMRDLIRRLESGLEGRDTDWDDLETLARDLEAGASAFAHYCYENLLETGKEDSQ